MNIWLSKKFIRVGSHTIFQSLKKRLVSISRKKWSKNTIAVLRNTSMTSWQVMNSRFMRMSPKVNSSQPYVYFKMSKIQQKLLAYEALHSKWSVCFFGKTGHVAIVPLEKPRTVNSKWYTTIYLPVVFQEIRKTNRWRRISLHHDNASSQTTAFLNTQNIYLMSHPPYSPDLTPNDFCLFPYVKKKWSQHFPTPEEAVVAFRMHVLEIPQKCIDLNGEYFGKQ